MKTVDMIIKADWVLPLDDDDKTLEHHAVVVHEGKIIDILPQAEVDQKYTADTVHDLKQHVLMPGLINAHTHTPMNLFRGLADDLELMDWLNNYIWPAEKAVINAKSVEVGCRLAIAEMLRSGTTCFNDHYFFPSVIANTAIEEGIRATVGHVIMNVPTDWAQDEDGYLKKATEITSQGKPHALINWSIAPHAPYTNSDSSLSKAKAISKQYNTVMHIHLHETQTEVDMSIEAHQKRPIQRLDDLDLVDEQLVAVHMTALNDEEIDLMATNNVSVVHCPESNMKLASGFAPVQKLLDKGVNVALGTDGAASNNDLDMFGEMRTAAFIAKGHSGDSTALPAATVLKMATINGAKALGIDDQTGSLTVGKAADMIAVDMSDYCQFPVYNPLSHLIYAVNSRQVQHVWVAGEHLLDQGKLTRLDIEGTMQQAQSIIAEIKQLSHLDTCKA
ncbi:MAG: TRZ/ATZ family hydrolase [Coxiellaceae bacterium]|nr:TRZ/ATZ family hydrolase [Coxiellaceae bacterium]